MIPDAVFESEQVTIISAEYVSVVGRRPLRRLQVSSHAGSDVVLIRGTRFDGAFMPNQAMSIHEDDVDTLVDLLRRVPMADDYVNTDRITHISADCVAVSGRRMPRVLRVYQTQGSEEINIVGVDGNNFALNNQRMSIHEDDVETLIRILTKLKAGPLGRLALDVEASSDTELRQ